VPAMICASHSRSIVVVIRSRLFIQSRQIAQVCSASISCDMMKVLVVGSRRGEVCEMK
jgi:hypothetical protein